MSEFAFSTKKMIAPSKKSTITILLGLSMTLNGCSHFSGSSAKELENPQYVINYLTAMDLLKMGKATEACELFKELSEGPSTLKNIASLRRELNCPDYKVELKEIPSWYSNLTRQIVKLRMPEKAIEKNTKPPKTWQEKLSALRAQRDFKAAIELLQTRIAATQDEEEQYQLYKILRQVYKTSQNRQAYLETGDFLLEVAKKSFDKDPKNSSNARRLNEAYALVAKAYWTDNFIEKAKMTLEEAANKLKDHYSLQEVLYLQGAIAKEQKELEKADTAFKLALAEKQNSPDIELRLLWSEAWLLMKLQKDLEARPLFQRYAQLHPDSLEKFRGQFWAARMLKKSDPALEKKELTDISQKDLLGYYGLISLRELGNPIPAAADTRKSLAEIENEKDRLLISEARDLLRIQENSAAAKLINQLQIRINRYTLFSYDPELVFPMLYPQEIKNSASKSKIPEELIYAIIRQESAFDPEARSMADALGLMQLLPSVAEASAKENKLKYSTAFDLFEPSINIPIGSFELKKLLKQYNNQFILAVARYNASEEAIQGWLKVRYSPDPLEFIEDIGYDETRNYVKLVMRNQISYQRLRAKNDFPFPEELLKWELKKTPIP